MKQNTIPELNEEMMRSLFNQGMTRHVRRQARRRIVVSSLAGAALMVGIGVRLMSHVEEKEAPVVAENHQQPTIPANVETGPAPSHPQSERIQPVAHVVAETGLRSPAYGLSDAHRASFTSLHHQEDVAGETGQAPSLHETPDPIFTLECNDHNSCDYLYVAAAFDHLLNINNA